MDKIAPLKEATDEVTRESLIAISYSDPEKVLSPHLPSGKLTGDNLVEVADYGENKYRSELISISYQQSPEIASLPVGQING